ncbi:MAG: hypothetical protein RDU83_01310 [bacterium]|nr:hypothetical protein [bacterium]
MTFLTERLSEIQRYLDHLEARRDEVVTPQDLESNLSLRNDVLFSLLMIAQMASPLRSSRSWCDSLAFGTS